MKQWIGIAVLALLGLTGCEDVIEVETPETETRLIVEGLIRVDTTQQYLPVAIRLSETASFFGEIRPVDDAEEVTIILQVFKADGSVETGNSELELSPEGNGVYIPVVVPGDVDERIATSIVNEDALYTLVITRNGRRYAAQTRYAPSVPIDQLALGEDSLFEADETELQVTYTDLPDQDNFYILDLGFGEYLPTEDTFYKGQTFGFSYFYDQSFAPGTVLEVGILGADQQFYNYMNLLVQQSQDQNNPFQTPVATVRGNVFDVTGLNNIDRFDSTGQPEVFPLGYFAIVQEFRDSITIP
ncbi:DUF4249 family protein [Robiginitalea sp. M366]|uniref:DUF4249 family protein n=1 Tax=Robiginitalea aestuariiviva TaxID=3036903 RepID=UPI00240E098C|nr:DUF4249 family protein [Robiginitalea aestuariiviva]MDG1572539.1 DUF4249 family protein [Robiginitalea aestuariiviva]